MIRHDRLSARGSSRGDRDPYVTVADRAYGEWHVLCSPRARPIERRIKVADLEIVTSSGIDEKIHTIRGQRVILDAGLAELFGVTPRRLNEQVRRNAERFPEDFVFILSYQELAILRSQFAASSSPWGG